MQDEGSRGPAAWRVVRRVSTASVKGTDGRHAYATSGAIGMPAGQRAWVEVVVSARANPRSECHAGSYRVVAHQIGDALAVNRR